MSPRRNHSSSAKIERVCTFLVVTSGKPSVRSKRIWWPNTLRVPVPVRSDFSTPVVEDALEKVEVRLHVLTLEPRTDSRQGRARRYCSGQ